MNTPASRLSACSVSFAAATTEQSTASNPPPPRPHGENKIPSAPHRGDPIAGPSSLSTDPYAARHVDDAIRRRAVNSPPKSPLRRPRHPPLPAASTPISQRLVFPPDRSNDASHGGLSDGGHIHIDGEAGSPVPPAISASDDLPAIRAVHAPIDTTDDPEDNLGPYHHPDYEDIPPHERALIEQCCRDDFGVASVREFQLQAIYAGAFYADSFLSINAKTGYGKSLIPLAIASMRRGISIVMMPLLGLGTDQVAKAIHVDINIEAWHIDEFRGPDGRALRRRLFAYTADQRDNLSIILYMSPQLLLPGSDWMPTLQHLAKHDYISQICVDEAHMVSLHGHGFRPEFRHAITSLKDLHAAQKVAFPRIVMSATYRGKDQQMVEDLFGAKPDFCIWTDMCRRRIYIDIVSSGTPTRTCTTCIKLDLQDNPSQKIIWYTNSKMKAEESLVPASENVLDTLGLDSEAMACTGGAGLPEKAFMLATFRGDDHLFTQPQRQELADMTMDEDECQPVNTSVLAATAAAQCGISSDKCHRCYRIGTPSNLYDLVQEMGRTDCDRSLPPGHNRFEMHVSWPNVVHLYVRIMKHKAGLERDNQMLRFHELMKLCFTPDECFHVALENYFEHPDYSGKRPACKLYCSFCSSDHNEFAGTFRKAELISILSTECFKGQPPSADHFVKIIKGFKDTIYEPNEVPRGVVGPIHGLCLQLLANGIIDLDINESGKAHVGKETLSSAHIVLKAGTVKKDGLPRILAYLDDDSWKGCRFIERALPPKVKKKQKVRILHYSFYSNS